MGLLLESNKEKINKEIEKIIPKNLTNEWLNLSLGNPTGEFDEKACTESISKPIWELLERGGKRWRPLLMKISYLITKKDQPENLIDKFLPIPELIHNGTLIVDDIEDNSNLRRGKPCIHKIFGDDIAINAGNSLYYIPIMQIMKNNEINSETKVRIYELINQEMIRLSFGQGMDIYWHKNKKIPTEKQYLQMCAFKTGTLARMSAKLGAIFAQAEEEKIEALGKFAESIGVAFQIQDDILNITNEKWGKDFGDDITEGKKSLIIINTLEQANEEDKIKLTEILESKTKDQNLISEAIKIIEKYPGIEKSRKTAEELILKGWNRIEDKIENSELKSKLKSFSEFMINREI